MRLIRNEELNRFEGEFTCDTIRNAQTALLKYVNNFFNDFYNRIAPHKEALVRSDIKFSLEVKTDKFIQTFSIVPLTEASERLLKQIYEES